MEKELKGLQATNLETGLSNQEVKERLAIYGYNEVPEKKVSFLARLGKRFWGIIPWMLEATAIVTFILGKYPQALVIVFLLLFNAGMSLWREGRAKAAMARLKQRLRIQSRVKRDGQWSTIPARELVPGDVVRVRIGDLLPADVRVVDGSLSLDQSVLTGESGTVDKSTGEIAYSGSAVKRGEATGIVDATGVKTYFGRTISLLEMAKPKLHMEEVTVKVARQLAILVLASLLIVFVYAVLTGFELAVLLPLAGVLLVASVPVAMPTMFTVNMALGSSVLAKQGVLVTRLSATEDAATMDVLCVDKTGTITINKLFVEEEVPLNGFSQNDVLFYGALASNEANQDPIDIAFLTAAAEAHIPLDGYTQAEFVPFDPKTRMTEATISKADEKFFVGKGSFDTICAVCNVPEEEAKAMVKFAEELSAKGLRVIAVAKGSDRSKLEFVGLAGIADRVREDSRQILDQIRGLGVEVKMLTGDSLPVAKNIAMQVGLGKNVTTMSKIQEAETKATPVDSVIEDSHGIAQIYPEDKFSIVKTLQRIGHVVGMTGDGVNDAPALGQAEVGIAVKNATDIAKDSASAVLTVEGLGGITSMIKTSRIIYQRIYSWALMMVARKLHIAGFIVVMLFLTHSLMLSITGTVLLLFLGDFVSMSISTDNVSSSKKPDTFDMRRLFGVSGSLGVLMTIESAIFTVFALSYFGLIGNVEKIYTFGFAYLNLAGVSALMIVRERDHFWKSKPSRFLSITVLAEVLFVIAISIFGVLELAPLGFIPVLAILGYALLTTFLINDPIKVYLMRKFKTTPKVKQSEAVAHG
ncbi:MAG: plasma-membrane proton-efflux P-type ATPase [Candidatus Bathyarchaeota archaeon]|nr:plasma-membrane proton-efflux P-type ATPase [Candidatus Bathyarchaeota archaeon]